MKSLVHKIKDKVHETRANMKDDKGTQPSEFPRTVSYLATYGSHCLFCIKLICFTIVSELGEILAL